MFKITHSQRNGLPQRKGVNKVSHSRGIANECFSKIHQSISGPFYDFNTERIFEVTDRFF
jgi:hypothetical protein